MTNKQKEWEEKWGVKAGDVICWNNTVEEKHLYITWMVHEKKMIGVYLFGNCWADHISLEEYLLDIKKKYGYTKKRFARTGITLNLNYE